MMDEVEVYDVRTVCLHTIKRDKRKTYDLIIVLTVLRGNLKSLLSVNPVTFELSLLQKRLKIPFLYRLLLSSILQISSRLDKYGDVSKTQYE